MKLTKRPILHSTVALMLLVHLFVHADDVINTPEQQLPLNLIVCLYNETNKKRADEYIICLKHNRKHPQIKNLHVIYDMTNDPELCGIIPRFLKKADISTSYTDKRQTFGDCIRCANELFPNQYVILSNADITFDRTLGQLEDRHIKKRLLAITRSGGRTVSARYSQDCWIFETPFPLDPMLDATRVGLHDCEKPIIWVAQKNGLRAYNPCRSIHCTHIHRSGVRHQHRNGRNMFGKMPLPLCDLEGRSGNCYRRKRSPTKKSRSQRGKKSSGN